VEARNGPGVPVSSTTTAASDPGVHTPTAGLSAGQLLGLVDRLAALGPDVTNSDVADASQHLRLVISALEEEAGRRAIRELLGS
jgi:hypothetical protein